MRPLIPALILAALATAAAAVALDDPPAPPAPGGAAGAGSGGDSWDGSTPSLACLQWTCTVLIEGDAAASVAVPASAARAAVRIEWDGSAVADLLLRARDGPGGSWSEARGASPLALELPLAPRPEGSTLDVHVWDPALSDADGTGVTVPVPFRASVEFVPAPSMR